MGESTCGDFLRSLREERGASLDQASAATRIRRKFLCAFEEGDFSEMPPMGYSRNMLATYSMYLGCDPNEVLSLFMREYDEYANAGSSLPSSNSIAFGRSEIYGNRSSSRGNAPVRSYSSRRFDSFGDELTSSTRSADDRGSSKYSRSGSHMSRKPQAASLEQRGGGAYQYAEQGNGSYNHFRDKPQSKLPLIVCVIVVGLLIIGGLTAWAFLSKNDTGSTVLPHVGSGVASVEQKESTADSSVQNGGVNLSTGASAPFSVSVSVDEGKSSVLTITIDGLEAYSGNAVGPFNKEYQVTKSIVMDISNPDVVHVSSNGNEIKPIVSNGKGSIDITVKTDSD